MALRILSYLILFCTTFPAVGWAQSMLNPVANVLQENGIPPSEPKNLIMDELFVGAAPLEVRFSANIELPTASLGYEWIFDDNADFSSPLLRRFDSETVYTFDRAGKFYIRLKVTDMETESSNESGTFIVQIAESELKIPNAFSPNGDGINDVFQVTHKSLVSFNAVVFNRWGQKLYQWGLSNIDSGWDGEAHGSQVPVGVYFIVIEALGADGVVYNHKGDINILR